MKRNALAVVVVALVVSAASAQIPFGPVEQLLVARFDGNKDGRLDAAERKAARTWLAANPGAGGGFFGGGRGFGPFGGRGGTPPAAGRSMTPADVTSGGNAPLYDTATLRTFFLQFEAPDWEQELSDFYNTDVEVPATLTVDGRVYRNVGVHFRGLSSYMMAGEGRKRSLNVSIDFVDDDQRLMGVRTINLLNANGDATFVRPVVYAEIANRYLPTPRANFARVVINGESWGIYINSEQFNSDFTRDRFKSARGARWKVPGSPAGGGGLSYLGDDAAAYRRLYEIRSRDDAESWAALIRLTKVLNETPAEKLEAAIAPMLDIDGALKFLAVEVALVNSDGYWSRASDYSLYRDEQGRFHVVPHDINEGLIDESAARFGGPGGLPPGFDPAQIFGPGGPPAGFPPLPPGGFGRGGPGGRGGFPGGFGRGGVDLDPLVGLDRADTPLRSKLLAVPALRERYLGYVRDIAEQSLDWNRLGPIVARYRALIEADVRADTRKLFSNEAFEAGLGDGESGLRSFVDRRRAFLLKTTAR
jgi:hypothetical protein